MIADAHLLLMPKRRQRANIGGAEEEDNKGDVNMGSFATDSLTTRRKGLCGRPRVCLTRIHTEEEDEKHSKNCFIYNS